MSLHAIGTDIVAVDRFETLLERQGEQFLNRCFRSDETATLPGAPVEHASTIAAFWAAKEAFLKALGMNVSDIPYHDVQIVDQGSGGFGLKLHGLAAARLEACAAGPVHLSLSHNRRTAVAFVVIEN